MSKEFTLKELHCMLEQYQTFVCRGVEITSPIHKNGPDMCRQLIRILESQEDMQAGRPQRKKPA